ncbi:MAG: VWA domain-containing protein [Clostridia bacterium]|nr:VWA domain-containing protein [Clostridia bacterium]
MMSKLEHFDQVLTFKGIFSLFLIAWLVFTMVILPTPASTAEATVTDDQGVDRPIVVSLGDSYSAGEGIEDFYGQHLPEAKKVLEEDWLAHRSENSWSGMLEIPGLDRELSYYKDQYWFFEACSGAITENLKNDQKRPYDRKSGLKDPNAKVTYQFKIFEDLPYGTVDYVTMTMGGNDIEFANIIYDAYMNSSTLDKDYIVNRLNKAWKLFFQDDGVREKLYNAYHDIENLAGPQATILIVGYPQLYEPGGKSFAVSKHEIEHINNATVEFNNEIKKLVEYCATEGMNIHFVSVDEKFEGHRAYSRNNPYIHPVHIFKYKEENLKKDDKQSSYSMHPNYEGAKRYAEAVQDKINELAKLQAEQEEMDATNPTPKEREIVMVLDGSGSMDGTPMDETKKAAHEFVNAVFKKAECNLGVAYYDDQGYVSASLSDSHTYLDKAIDQIDAGGGTNIEAGLQMAENMLQDSTAKKKIVVLMSDGLANTGKTGQELIDYANQLKAEGFYIYTLGFFFGLDGYDKTEAQSLMEGIASEGGHYEVTDAESLAFFFGEIAAQASGDKYIYVKIACPVDVTVSYNGETMTSKDQESSVRTSFGSMTFEQNSDSSYEDYSYNEYEEPSDTDDRIKILRLKEGVDYDIEIEGNDYGTMDYTIGFVDEEGEYNDMRRFHNVNITEQTKIDTVAGVAEETYMYVDEDGDGSYDITYRAEAGGYAEIVDYTYLIYIGIAIVVVLLIAIAVFIFIRRYKISRYL